MRALLAPGTPRRRAGRLVRLASLALACAASLSAPRPALADKAKDDEALNYFLRVPERWSFVTPIPPALAKQGVVEIADCRLEMLADGKTPGTGQGGRVMLSVQDVPKDFEADFETWLFELQTLSARADAESEQFGEVSEELAKQISDSRQKLEKPLASLANRPEVQALLLSRWEADPKKQPHLEPDAAGVQLAGLPAAVVKHDGPCANLEGNSDTCEGRMYVWVVRKRMYRLALWAWPNKYDRERIRDDADNIELNFVVPKSTAIPRKLPDPTKGLDPKDPKADPESLEEKVKEDKERGFVLKKPVKFKSFPIDRSRPDQVNLGYRMDATSGASSCTIELLVYRTRPGEAPFNPDTFLQDYYSAFAAGHPRGDIETAPFGPVTKKQPFLSLPDMEKKFTVRAPDRPYNKPQKEKPAAPDKDKPDAPPAPDKPEKDKPAKPEKEKPDKEDKLTVNQIEKLLVLTESKGIDLDGQHLRSTWRACLKGYKERLGEELYLLYMFQASDRTYVVRILCRREGYVSFKDGIAAFLASFKLVEPPK